MNSIQILLPEIFFFLFLMVVFLSNSLQSGIFGQSYTFKAAVLSYFTISDLLKSLYLLGFFFCLNLPCWYVTKYFCGYFLMTTPLIYSLKFFILISSILILKGSSLYIYLERYDLKDFYLLYGFFILLLCIFLHISDFFLLFVVFEMISLLLYCLISFKKKGISFSLVFKNTFFLKYYRFFTLYLASKSTFSFLSITAGLLYFIFNAFFSGLFLMGLSFLFYYFSQSSFFYIFLSLIDHFIILDFQSLNQKQFLFLFFCCFSFLFFFFFKLALAPFHWQISAVYEGSSFLLLLFFSIPLKFVYLLMFIKILFNFFSFFFPWIKLIFLIVAIFSLIFGSLGLLSQTKLKKFQAFSTVNHMGYLLLACVCFSFLGLRAFFVYSCFYFLINFFFFFFFQNLINESLGIRFLYINQLSDLFLYRRSLLAFCFFIFIFSLIGVPPFLGFQGKYLVLCALFQSFSFSLFLFIFFQVVITSLITAYAYLGLQKLLNYETKVTRFFLITPFALFDIYFLQFCCLLFFFSFLFFFLDSYFFYIDNFQFLQIFSQ